MAALSIRSAGATAGRPSSFATHAEDTASQQNQFIVRSAKSTTKEGNKEVQQPKNSNDSKAVAVVDPVTGEVVSAAEEQFAAEDIIQASALECIVRDLRVPESNLPLQEQHLQAIEDPEVAEFIANLYYGLDSVLLKDLAGREIVVLGMAIVEHGPYQGKDGNFHPEGFYQPLILAIDDSKKGNPPMLIRTSSVGVGMHIARIIRKRGWFLFEHPRRYRVMRGSNNALHLYDTAHELSERYLKDSIAH